MMACTMDHPASAPATTRAAPEARWLDVECVDGHAATVYVRGPLSPHDILELRRLATSLPPRVHILRIQLRVAEVNPGTIQALEMLGRTWRGRGSVHLVLVGQPAHLIAPD